MKHSLQEQSYAQALRNITLRYEQMVQSLSILREMDALEGTALEMEELCRRILETIALGLAAENCSLMLMAEDGPYLELRAACSSVEEQGIAFRPGEWNGPRFRMGEGVVGKAAELRQPVRVEDVAEHPDFLPLRSSSVEIGSLICFPLCVGDRTIGVLNLSHSRPGFFSLDSERVLTLIAERAARILAMLFLRQQVKRLEDHYRAVTRNASDCILVFDADGRLLSVNPAVEELTGMAAERYITGEVDWTGGVHPDDAVRYANWCQRIFYQQREGSLRYRCVTKAGDVREIEERSTLLLDATGELSQVVSVVHDVTDCMQAQQDLLRSREDLDRIGREQHTQLLQLNQDLERNIAERQRIEEALRQQELRFRTIYNCSALGICESTLDGRMIDVNPAFADMFGYASPEEMCNLVSSSQESLYWDPCRREDMLQRVLETTGPVTFEVDYKRKDGTGFIGRVRLQAVRNEYDEVLYLYGFVEDITREKEAERELKQLAAALQQTAEAVVITDGDRRILYANAAYERISGFTVEELLGRQVPVNADSEFDGAFFERVLELVRLHGNWRGRVREVNRDGAFGEVEVTISPIRDTRGEIVSYVGVGRDMTAEAELQAQLRQAQRVEAVGQLASGVAHDFNNILQTIEGYTSLVLDELDPASDEGGFLQEVINATDRASMLTKQLLAFSRQQLMQPQDIDINYVISDMIGMLRRLVGSGIELEICCDPDVKTIHADPGQLGQVLVNLCANARDALPEGGVVQLSTDNLTIDDSFRATHLWAHPGDYVRLVVADNGVGMTADVQDRIFEPFFTTKDVGEGTGLGLSSVYGIVQQHQGQLNVSSVPEQGTTFEVYFPAVDREASYEFPSAAQHVAGGYERILLAEEDPAVQQVTARVLRKAGYKVELVHNTVEALARLTNAPDGSDLLVLNVVLPQKDYMAFIEQVRRVRPDFPVIFSSGYSVKEEADGPVGAPLVERIAKPHSPVELLTLIRRLLDQAQGDVSAY